MALGSLRCPSDRRKQIGRAIQELKRRHNIGASIETKWTKISPARLDFYIELVDLFYRDSALKFRSVVVPDKSVLDHGRFQQSHDDFYYKMWFLLLDRQIAPGQPSRIFVDIKDTRGAEKIHKLHEVLCHSKLDFDRNLILGVEQVRSHHVPLLQITDVLTGAVTYANRQLKTSPAKLEVLRRIRELSGVTLTQTTFLKEEKTNILVWNAQQ